MKNKVLEMLISAALGTALGLAFTGVMPAMAADTNSNTVTQQVMEISDSETDNADTAGSLSVEPSSSSLADSTVQEDEDSSANREKSDTPESDEAEESTADFDDVTDSSKETILEEEQNSEPSPSDIKSNKTSSEAQTKDNKKKEEKNIGKNWYKITPKDIVIQLIIAFIIFVIPGYWICFVRNKR